MKYRKTQIGWVAIGLFVPVILFLLLAYANQWGDNPLPLIPFIILVGLFVVISSLFYKLTVELEESVLRLIYGIGLIRITFKIDRILAVKTIKTPWYWGLGIRITPKGMLYNIQGSKAVKIAYIRNGKNKSVMVGTPEPVRLKQILEENFKRQIQDS